MDNVPSKEEGRARAPNPWPKPCKTNYIEFIEKNGKSSSKPKSYTNHSDNKSCYSASTQSSILSRGPKSFKCSDQQSYRSRELKPSTARSCVTRAKQTNPKSSIESKDSSSPSNNRDTASETNYYSSNAYGKKSTSVRNVFNDNTPSPRGLTRDKEAIQKSLRRPVPFSDRKNVTKVEKQSRFSPKRNMIIPEIELLNKTLMPETMRIETRRTIVREGGIKFEEISVIQFPHNLPRNVQVITAQFVPGSYKQQ